MEWSHQTVRWGARLALILLTRILRMIQYEEELCCSSDISYKSGQMYESRFWHICVGVSV